MIKKNLGPVTAYALAVKNGFEGTESEWLESLKGTPEWSLVQNKPVEYESIGDTITWDGNEEGKIACSFPVWFLIAPLNDADVEKIRANPELFEQGVSVDQEGIERGFDRAEKDVLYYEDESVVIILKDNLAPYANHPTMTYPYKGVYFYSGGQSEGGVHTTIITASFTVPGFEFHKEVLKPDYVPYAVMTKPQSLTEQQQMQARKNLDLPYTEGGIGEILPETILDMSAGETTLPNNIGLVEGQEYTVVWNGESYTCTAIAAEEEGMPIVVIGNLTEDPNAGEPFFMVEVPADMVGAIGFAVYIGCWEQGMIPISITHNAETIRKLDGKYLPEGVPYSEGVKLVELLSETEVMVSGGSSTLISESATLEVGKTYHITYNGVEYVCVAEDYSFMRPGAVIVGNGKIALLPDTGEPFAIVSTPGAGLKLTDCTTMESGGDALVTVAIHETSEAVHKLDGKLLPDGLPYTEGDTVEMLPETEIMASPDGAQIPLNATLKAGATYLVKYNGVDYLCVGQDMSMIEFGHVAVGNLAAFGLPSTGEPFMLLFTLNDGIVLVDYAAIENGAGAFVTLAIYRDNRIVHKLDRKFLPTAAAVDMTAYESEGKIVETYPDGSEVTTTIEFDASGNPVKITDSFGNVTEVAW